MFLISEFLSLRLNNDTKVTRFGSEKQVIPVNGEGIPVNGEMSRIIKIVASVLFLPVIFAGNYLKADYNLIITIFSMC